MVKVACACLFSSLLLIIVCTLFCITEGFSFGGVANRLRGRSGGNAKEADKSLMELGLYSGADVVPSYISRTAIIKAHSFMPPMLSEYWSTGLRHFDFGLSTAVTNDYIRLTPSKQSRVGYIWNIHPSHMTSWSWNIGFRVHSLSTVGGDGMAFWYVETPGATPGEGVMGLPQPFKGLGILVDTFDNDGIRDNPKISVILGDGTELGGKFDPSTDFVNAPGACPAMNIRNTKVTDIVHLAAEYHEKTLEISVRTESAHTPCITLYDVDLPAGYFFGATAMTGDVADNHDIYYSIVMTATAQQRKEEELIEQEMREGVGNYREPPLFSHHEEKKEMTRWDDTNGE